MPCIFRLSKYLYDNNIQTYKNSLFSGSKYNLFERHAGCILHSKHYFNSATPCTAHPQPMEPPNVKDRRISKPLFAY